MPPTEFCGTSLAAKKLGLSVGTVQALVEKNELLAWKTEGGHRRISLKSISDYQKRYGQPNGEHKDRLAPLKVLLVGADRETYDALQRVRQPAGVAVECIWMTSAFKALINLQTLQPDLLIADLSMANVDGYDLLRTVRANHKAEALPLVGLTATDPAEVAVQGNLPADITLVQKTVNTDWFQGYFACHIALRKLSA